MSRILFAEDDVAMRYMVLDLLMSAGHAVRVVADGAMALHEMRADPPDLVLLDYRMGKPDGFDVCRRIKDDPGLRHLPVLILTGIGGIEDRIAGFAAGADDFLAKPFDTRELLARVNALLRLSEQGRDLNPTTGLPGGSSIDREFQRRVQLGQAFTLCYLDLNNFKAFNDHFGFALANSLISFLGREMRLLVAGTRNFAGHVGGDDFVMMCAPSDARRLVEGVQRRLRDAVLQLVPETVAEAGVYRGRLRDGTDDFISLTGAIGVLLHLPASARLPSLVQLGEVAAEAKVSAKHTSPDCILEIEIDRTDPEPQITADQGVKSSPPPSRPRRSSRKW